MAFNWKRKVIIRKRISNGVASDLIIGDALEVVVIDVMKCNFKVFHNFRKHSENSGQKNAIQHSSSSYYKQALYP